jgi:hypothetical protein
MLVILLQHQTKLELAEFSKDLIQTRNLARKIRPYVAGKRVRMISSMSKDAQSVATIASQELSIQHDLSPILGHDDQLIPRFMELSDLVDQYSAVFEVLIFVVHRLVVINFPSWYGIRYCNRPPLPLHKRATKDDLALIYTKVCDP